MYLWYFFRLQKKSNFCTELLLRWKLATYCPRFIFLTKYYSNSWNSTCEKLINYITDNTDTLSVWKQNFITTQSIINYKSALPFCKKNTSPYHTVTPVKYHPPEVEEEQELTAFCPLFYFTQQSIFGSDTLNMSFS